MQLFNFTKINLLNFFFFSEIKTSPIPNGQAYLDFRFFCFVQKNMNKTKQGLFGFFLVLLPIAILHLLIALMENEASWGRTMKELAKQKEKQLYCQTSEQTILTQVPANTSYTLYVLSCPAHNFANSQIKNFLGRVCFLAIILKPN